MNCSINISSTRDLDTNTAWIASIESIKNDSRLSDSAKAQLSKGLESKLPVAAYFEGSWLFAINASEEKDSVKRAEAIRKAGSRLLAAAKSRKIETLNLDAMDGSKEDLYALLEGVFLSNYDFKKYQKRSEEYEGLTQISLAPGHFNETELEALQAPLLGTILARDLVNEPLSYLTAVQLSEEIKKAGNDAGFSVEVLDKAKIESLGMGGLLAVNRGSLDPPTFSIMEYKPANAVNEKPIVLVGKGVVYDTGGLSLKPTPNSMDLMKSDMGGSAVVIGGIYSAAKANLPLHIIALVPATDNRPGVNAYAPGDVVHMYDGTNVEVLNTDAEGRMLLADALAYAKQYEPELVFDFATLTGAAARAIGPVGIVCMGSAEESTKNMLKESGNEVYERLVEFPMWDEYGDMLKSDIADMKNIGGPYAGAITAGKFLEHFTDYPWMHFDIAGPTFIAKPDHYRTKGATGTGVRMLFQFLNKRSQG